jgi:DNA-binding GntR family transcriptional regulator
VSGIQYPVDSRQLRPAALSRLIATELRRDILFGRLEAGTHVRQEQLCARFGTSRMPVRDALRQLQSEGLLEEDRGHRLLIGTFDVESIRDVYAVKAAAHARAARRATQRSSDAELDTLVEINKRMARASDAGNAAELSECNWQFHRRINRLARAPYLLATLRALPIRFDGSAFGKDSPWTRQCISEHDEVLNAMTHREPDDAEALMAEHVSHSVDFMISWLNTARDNSVGRASSPAIEPLSASPAGHNLADEPARNYFTSS